MCGDKILSFDLTRCDTGVSDIEIARQLSIVSQKYGWYYIVVFLMLQYGECFCFIDILFEERLEFCCSFVNKRFRPNGFDFTPYLIRFSEEADKETFTFGAMRVEGITFGVFVTNGC